MDLEQPADQFSALTGEDVPANNFPTEQIHEQVRIETQAAHFAGQVADAPFVADPEVSLLVLRASPALSSTRTQPNQGAGILQMGTVVAGLLDQGQQYLAMLASGQFSWSFRKA